MCARSVFLACLQTGCCAGLAVGACPGLQETAGGRHHVPWLPWPQRRRCLGGCPIPLTQAANSASALLSVHCLLTTGLEDSNAWKVNKTGWCVSPWHHDRLRAVGTLLQEPPSGRGLLTGAQPRLAPADSSPRVSCWASSGGLLGGEGGIRAVVTVASLRMGPLQASPSPAFSPLQGAAEEVGREPGGQSQKADSESWLGLC